MTLIVDGKTYEGKNQAECLRDLLNEDSLTAGKVQELFLAWLNEYDQFDEDGELIDHEYTDGELLEAWDRAAGNNPDVITYEWNEAEA